MPAARGCECCNLAYLNYRLCDVKKALNRQGQSDMMQEVRVDCLMELREGFWTRIL